MTQKELLYVEDAIEHEKSIIKICETYLNDLSNDNTLQTFIHEQIYDHEEAKNKLLSLLKELSNE